MEFTNLVLDVLSETNVAGGATSAFGSGVVSTASAKSGDSYASNDSRKAAPLYSGLVTRFGTTGSQRSPKSRKKTYKKKKQWM